MNLNVKIRNEELFERFKKVSYDRGTVLESSILEAMTLYIFKNSARTRMEQRVSFILTNLGGGGNISEKGLHNLLNTYEWVSIKTVQEIIAELIVRKLCTSHMEKGNVMLYFEKVN